VVGHLTTSPSLRRVAATSDLSPDARAYTVDEVAELTGTTVRTIRWYQSEGLLPSPRRLGRVAMYDADHVARLESIRDLQAHGLTLVAIRRLLDRAPGSAAATALAFVKAAVAQSAEAEREAEVITAAEGAARLHIDIDEVDPQLVESLGLVRVLDDGRWRVIAPAAFEASAELAKAGVPLERRVAIGRVLKEHTQAMAEAVVELFVDYMWRPTQHGGGLDPAAWEVLTEAVERLRPLAATAIASLFDAAVAHQSELATARELNPPTDPVPPG
jgi:DNA-binding transcriptional MerR regulator